MPGKEVEGLFMKGLDALAKGNTLSALSSFEKAINIENSPVVSSYYAFCIAKERGQVRKAISLCEEAIKKEPKSSLHYLNLGRIYLIAKNKEDAIKTFREVLHNQQIVDELNRFEPRRPPVIPFLKRSNPINKYLGIMLRTKKKLIILYALFSLLLALTVAPVLLPCLFSEKPEVSSPPSEVRHEAAPPPPEVRHDNLVESKHDIPHTLELIARDKTWVFVNIDGGESKEMLLNQGERITWSAKNVFSLKIGNAGGITLIFDGREIGPLGEKGQVISLKLPPSIISRKDMVTLQQRAEMPKPAGNRLDGTPKALAQELKEPEKLKED